ncbi:MAG TPA: hypothetical protein VGB55_02470 [Tepidisphaeraceae bacterium]
MMRALALSAVALVLAGCGGAPQPSVRTPVDQALFGASGMRLHPVFTKVTDWTGDGQPDGIEAVVEMQDQFGDPTKASGRIIFELHSYKPMSPDPRGQRVVAPWEGRLDSLEDQRSRWNRVNRAYIFQLAYPAVGTQSDYVLSSTFERSDGGRFFARAILEGDRNNAAPSAPPALAPSNSAPAAPSAAPSLPQEPTSAHTPPPRADQP